MESPLKIQPKVGPLSKPSTPAFPDKQQLLLLGLQLLNKGLKLPTAVVQPQVQRSTNPSPPSPPACKPLKQSPPSSPGSSAVSSEDESEKSTLSPVILGRKRKRNGNDDLSEVDKKEKRKMMNRVAAQNARDRKKAYVEDLEKRVALLEDKNKALQQENSSLKQRTTTLTEEKNRLEKRLATSIQSDLQEALVRGGHLGDSAIGSAAETNLQGSSLPSVDAAQPDILALLLEEGLSSQLSTDFFTGPGLVTRQSHDLVVAGQQQSVSVEGGAVVGSQRERVEPTKELNGNQPNPMSFLNTDNLNTDTAVELATGLFDSTLDSILGSSAEDVGIGTTPPSSSTPFPLVTSCEVTNVSGESDGANILFDAETDLDKLLYPFAESILNPVGGDFDTWDVESMLTAS